MIRNKKERGFGLSGGIGAGKSTVADRFRKLGAIVLDADEVSRNALNPGTPCYYSVISHFGSRVLNDDGTANRGAIADIVFSNESERRFLNSIIHPYVLQTLYDQYDASLREDPDAVLVFDIPLLIECGAYQLMNKNIIVVADDDIRIDRIMRRNGMTDEKARMRIQSQISQEEQKKYADYVIYNNGTMQQLISQTDSVYTHILESII